MKRLFRVIFLIGLMAALSPADVIRSNAFSASWSGTPGNFVDGPDTPGVHQSLQIVDVDYRHRFPIGASPWRWSLGMRGDYYAVHNPQPFPVQHLQGYAAQIGFEFFQGPDIAASLILRPGVYFQSQCTAKAWDIPADLVAGIPLREHWNAVVGFSVARLYDNQIPVAGVSWQARPDLRVDAVYPEPAAVWAVRERQALSVGGHLVGGGFKTDERTGHAHAEFYVYRVGAAWAWREPDGWSPSVQAGYEAKRLWNFYSESVHDTGAGAPYLQLGIEF